MTSNQALEQQLLHALKALTRGDVAPWSAMFADDGVQEFPYAPAGYPARISGRRAIADYLADYPKLFKLDRIVDPVFYPSGSVLVLEFAVEGTALQTGKPYNQRYVSVIEHNAGQITRYVDYWNPLVAIEALGGADEVLAFGNKKA